MVNRLITTHNEEFNSGDSKPEQFCGAPAPQNPSVTETKTVIHCPTPPNLLPVRPNQLLFLTNIRTFQQQAEELADEHKINNPVMRKHFIEHQYYLRNKSINARRGFQKKMKGKPFCMRKYPSYFCKKHSIALLSCDNNREFKQALFKRIPCNSWRCPRCYEQKLKKIKFKLHQIIEMNQLTYFLTLTLAQDKIPNSVKGNGYNFTHKYITKLYNHFRTVLVRKKFKYFHKAKKRWYSFELKNADKKLKYVWIIEFQDNNNAHMHILFNQFLPIEVIRKIWSHVGGGHIMHIENVRSIKRVASYVTKYLSKDFTESSTKNSGFKFYERRYSISKFCDRPKNNAFHFLKEALTEKQKLLILEKFNLDWLYDIMQNFKVDQKILIFDYPKVEDKTSKDL